MEVLNEAVGRLSSNQLRWLDVNLDIATSHIKIVDTKVGTHAGVRQGAVT